MAVPEQSVHLTTNPFLMENAIWLCLDFIFSGGHKAVRLRPEATEEGACIRMTVPGGLPELASGGGGPSSKLKPLLEVLQADLRIGPGGGEIILFLRKQV